MIALLLTSKKVFIDSLFGGGVERNEKSFNPEKAIFIVLGMGVADIYKIWVESCLFLIRFFCLAPNLCSSSTTINPTFSNDKFSLNNACVPINKSIFLLLKSS